jgi:hypothetical protein
VSPDLLPPCRRHRLRLRVRELRRLLSQERDPLRTRRLRDDLVDTLRILGPAGPAIPSVDLRRFHAVPPPLSILATNG